MFGMNEERHDRRRCARGRFGFSGFSGFHGGHRRHRGGGRRHGRIFDHGDLRLVILRLIAEGPRHGYEIIKEIEEKLGGAYSPSPGVVYPTLMLLEELGYANVTTGDGTKKLYAVTEEGAAYLAANKAAVDAIFGRIAEVGSAHGNGPAPQIVRAMENLTLALRLRLSQGPLTEQQKQAVAAALDAAAVTIERS
jgi:DNA-binding PadR family transcriptional regulator